MFESIESFAESTETFSLGTRMTMGKRKLAEPIDKPNLRGYNIPVICTAGISGGVGNGTNGNPKEDPRSWEKRISGKGLQGRISE
jgi:hypothetical protein